MSTATRRPRPGAWSTSSTSAARPSRRCTGRGWRSSSAMTCTTSRPGSVIPTPAVQEALRPLLQDNVRAAMLHHKPYSMVAYPWAQRYQQSNQWGAGDAGLRGGARRLRPPPRAQAWLQFKGYQPTTLNLSAGPAPRCPRRHRQRRLRRPPDRAPLLRTASTPSPSIRCSHSCSVRDWPARHRPCADRLAAPQTTARITGGTLHYSLPAAPIPARPPLTTTKRTAPDESPRPGQPIRAARPAPLRPVLLDPVPRRPATTTCPSSPSPCW